MGSHLKEINERLDQARVKLDEILSLRQEGPDKSKNESGLEFMKRLEVLEVELWKHINRVEWLTKVN